MSEENISEETKAPAKRARKPRASRKAAPVSFVGRPPATAIPSKDPAVFGRVPVMAFVPAVDDGIFPARVELGEAFRVEATVAMDAGRTVRATALLKTVRGKVMARVPMTALPGDSDRWAAMLRVGEHSDLNPWDAGYGDVAAQLGTWKVSVEGWEDTYVDWQAKAKATFDAGADPEHVLAEGAELLTRWAASRDAALDTETKRMLRETAKTMGDTTIPALERFEIATTDEVKALNAASPLRDGLTQGRDHVFHVERPKSSFASWYQFFPRSEGASVNEHSETVPGTLSTAVAGLERAAREGFGIVYLPPVYPLGEPVGAPADPLADTAKGERPRAIAIGNDNGGFDTVDPQLGTMDDFRAFTTRAHELGLEVALDFTLTLAPGNPWVAEHADWFKPAADGTLTPDYDLALDDLAKLVAATLTGWADAGVTAFRIGTPDGAPVRFWQDVIEAVAKTHPEVLFLAKDVTRSAMLEALGCAGFTQDDGTFPWHTTKGEIEAVLAAANGTAAYAHHDAFWPNTQDVRSGYLRDNGTAGHAVRAVLAAMGSPSWGLTTGYELVEAARREDGTIGTANEQYEVQVRDWATADGYGIAELVGTLNRVRREHPAAASYHDLTVLPSANPAVVAFARYVPAECTGTGKPDMLIMVVNLDCYHEQQSQIHVELTDFGLPTDGTYKVHDELTGREFDWSWDNYVALAPWADVAHILSVEF